jgi:hypothetical protein
MKIATEYIDFQGNVVNRDIAISRLAFIKHMGIAGQGYAPSLDKIRKVFGMFFVYKSYLRSDEFYGQNRFSEPPIRFSDPTEKSQFSNIAGKSIADYFSKKLNNSILTVNYEAAMRLKGLPISGSRPDLLAFTDSKIFAVESKGFSSSSSGDMSIHKTQSQAGPIQVNFSIASVSYDLYSKTKCKYHDPVNPYSEYDDELLKILSKEYYSGIKEYFDEKYFIRNEMEVNGELFYELDLITPRFVRSFGFDGFPWIWPDIKFMLSEGLRFKLIVPKNIDQLAELGINRDTEPFIIGESETNYLYIDNDRIGLKIGNRR